MARQCKAATHRKILGSEPVLGEEFGAAVTEVFPCLFSDGHHTVFLTGEGFGGQPQHIAVVAARKAAVAGDGHAADPLFLPLLQVGGGKIAPADILYEPDCATVFNAMIPEYLGGVIYGALCESLASELSARRMAMDSATQNADEMIDKLNLQYNRARQGSITQELTEIVAGAEE